MELTLVVSDCPALEAAAGPAERAALPSLPALESLLRRANRRAAGEDWRAGLWRASVGGEPPAPAAVAAAALPGITGEVWLAQPVHLQAAADHLRLHTAGLLRVEEEQARELAEDFARVFGADGLALHPLCGRFVLSGVPVGAGPPDPAPHAGTRLDAPLRSGPPALRRLVGETELWLHEHAVNQARARHGQLGISALWIWGGGSAVTRAAAGAAAAAAAGAGADAGLQRFVGDDPFVAGLAAASGSDFVPAPPALAASDLLVPGVSRMTVQVSAAAQVRQPASALARIDREIIAPVAALMRTGAVARLELWIAGLRATLRPHHRWRVWRRSRRWWEHAPR